MSDQQTPQEVPQPTPARPPFDEAVCNRLRDAFQDVFLNHPEVKCLSATITWNGALNDAQILHGIWLGPDGPVQTPDGIIGSLHQTMKMLDEQAARGMNLITYVRDQVQVLSTEAANKYEEVQTLQAEIDRKRAELQALYDGEAAAGEDDGRGQGDA